jgi:hypothetical protein
MTVRKSYRPGRHVKGAVTLDHWGRGKLDQMSMWELGISTEGGVWSGGQRPLGIPTIRDRAVQMAAVLILSPIFEADLLPQHYDTGRAAP